MQVQVNKVMSYQGPAVQYRGDDGWPAMVCVPVLIAIGCDGQMFQLPNRMRYEDNGDGEFYPAFDFSLCRAQEMESEILDRGYIVADHWVAVSEEEMREYNQGAYGS